MRDQEKEESATRLLDEINLSKKEGAVLREAFEASEEGKKYIEHIRRIVWGIPEEIQAIDKFTPLQPHHILEKMKLIRALEDEKQRLEAQCEHLIERYEQKLVAPVIETAEIADNNRIASAIPFNQAIEKMYRHYHERHEYDLIRPDYVDAFIQKMGELLKKEGTPHPEDEMELINYLAVRIKEVKKEFRAWKITIQEIEVRTKSGLKTAAALGSYAKKEVTKKLCLLRKKHPIPCTIPIP